MLHARARAARRLSSTTCATNAPFAKIMAANRGEIAVRIMRAGTEMNIRTVGIYSQEDRFTPHRYKCDESFQIPVKEGTTPVGAYLDAHTIVDIAKTNGVEAIHPGYGFLSENVEFATGETFLFVYMTKYFTNLIELLMNIISRRGERDDVRRPHAEEPCGVRGQDLRAAARDRCGSPRRPRHGRTCRDVRRCSSVHRGIRSPDHYQSCAWRRRSRHARRKGSVRSA